MVQMGIVTKGLGGTHLITSGYGYIGIVVAPPAVTHPRRKPKAPPRVIRIPAEYEFILRGLGIIKKFTQDINVHGLSVIKAEEVEILLAGLGIVLPDEVQVLLHVLAIARSEDTEISLEQLEVIKKTEQYYILSPLSLIAKVEKEIGVAELKLLSEMINDLQVAPPDIYKIKTKELAKKLKKYIDLYDLIESIDKAE